MQGLSKNPQGTWVWDESLPLSSTGHPDSQPSIDPLVSTSNVHPIVIEDQPNSNGATITQLEKLFDVRLGTGTPSHNTIEVKRERLEVSGDNLPTVDKPEIPSSEIRAHAPMIVDSRVVGSHSDAVATDRPPGEAESSTSPIVRQKRSRSPVSNQGRKHVKRIRRAVRTLMTTSNLRFTL